MDYILIIILQFIGVGLRCMQTIAGLRVKYKEADMNTILNTFLKEDWNTLFVSALVLILNLVAHYIIGTSGVEWSKTQNYLFISYGIALVLGFAGQMLIYKWLGTATQRLDKEVTNKLQ